MNKMRVVLAEEHAILSKIIREFLERIPDVIVLAEVRDGREVPELVKRLEPDILILDIRLPGMNGTEITQKIIAEGIPVQILVLSDFTEKAYLKSFLRDFGVAGYILKDEGLEVLAKAIQSIAHGDLEWLRTRAAQQLGDKRKGTNTNLV